MIRRGEPHRVADSRSTTPSLANRVPAPWSTRGRTGRRQPFHYAVVAARKPSPWTSRGRADDETTPTTALTPESTAASRSARPAVCCCRPCCCVCVCSFLFLLVILPPFGDPCVLLHNCLTTDGTPVCYYCCLIRHSYCVAVLYCLAVALILLLYHRPSVIC